MPRTKPKERIVLYVSTENVDKLKAFYIMLENNISLNTMQEMARFRDNTTKKKNDAFVKTYEETKNLKFGISAEDFLKSRGQELPSRDVGDDMNITQDVAEDFTEWKNCAEMRNIYDEVNYDMNVGYVPLTENNARFVMGDGKELYAKLKNGIYTPGFDVNKIMTEIYNLWRKTNA